MFSSKKKKQREFEQASRRFLVGSALLKAAVADDKDAMKPFLSQQAASAEELEYVLDTFIMVAHRHPLVTERLVELLPSMPDKAQQAFSTGIVAAKSGNPSLVESDNPLGPTLLIAYLAGAIAEEDESLVDAMTMLAEGA